MAQHNSLLINRKRWWNLRICRKGQMSDQFHGGSSFFLYFFFFFVEKSRQFLFVFTLLSTEEQPPPSKSSLSQMRCTFQPTQWHIYVEFSIGIYIYRWCCPSFSILSSNGLSTSCAAAGHARPEVTRAKSRENQWVSYYFLSLLYSI